MSIKISLLNIPSSIDSALQTYSQWHGATTILEERTPPQNTYEIETHASCDLLSQAFELANPSVLGTLASHPAVSVSEPLASAAQHADGSSRCVVDPDKSEDSRAVPWQE